MSTIKKFFNSTNALIKTNFQEIPEEAILKFYLEWSNLYEKTYSKYPKKFFADDPIPFYCGNEHKRINSFLLNDCLNNEKTQKDVNILCDIIYGAPRFPQNAILYRSITEDELQYYKKGCRKKNVTGFKIFLSTSITKDGTQINADYPFLLKIYLPKDVPAIYIDNICSRNEKEVLLPPGGQLKLLSNKYKDKETNKPTYDCYISY